MLKIDIITIFPKMFEAVLGESILKRAQEKKKAAYRIYDLRDYTDDPHRKVDDKPFGGGAGMLIRPEPVFKIIEEIKNGSPQAEVILPTPQGEVFDYQQAEKLSRGSHLIFICPHYEGIDERVRENLVDKEISIGDYVLTGGELPALVIIDAAVRLIPGVVGDETSIRYDSFSDYMLEHPHYTRPADFRGLKVPEILISGNHAQIKKWRREKSLARTKKVRPDLIKRYKDLKLKAE